MNSRVVALALFLVLLSLHPQAQPLQPAPGSARVVVLFDEGWKFHRGGAQFAEQPAFDDASWRVRSTNRPGDIRLTVSSAGLPSSSITIHSTRESR